MIWEEINKKDLLYLNSDLLSLLFEFKIVNSREMDDYKVFHSFGEFRYSVINPLRDSTITLDIYTLTEEPRVLERRLHLKIPNSQGIKINETLCKSVNLVVQELGPMNRIHETGRYIINDRKVYPEDTADFITTTTTTTTSTTLKPQYIEDLDSNFNYAEYFKFKMRERNEI